MVVKTNSFRPGGKEAMAHAGRPARATGLYDSEGQMDKSRVRPEPKLEKGSLGPTGTFSGWRIQREMEQAADGMWVKKAEFAQAPWLKTAEMNPKHERSLQHHWTKEQVNENANE